MWTYCVQYVDNLLMKCWCFQKMWTKCGQLVEYHNCQIAPNILTMSISLRGNVAMNNENRPYKRGLCNQSLPLLQDFSRCGQPFQIPYGSPGIQSEFHPEGQDENGNNSGIKDRFTLWIPSQNKSWGSSEVTSMLDQLDFIVVRSQEVIEELWSAKNLPIVSRFHLRGRYQAEWEGGVGRGGGGGVGGIPHTQKLTTRGWVRWGRKEGRMAIGEGEEAANEGACGRQQTSCL